MGRYPPLEPYAEGLLDVGDGNAVHWETSGNPNGKPAVVLHGGPGSGSSPRTRGLFDPAAYRIVQLDQRNCGRSTPHAGEATIDLTHNTTANLVADIELLREHLGIDGWLVWGASWGSTLALAYAESHPDRVTEAVLAGVTTGRHEEFDWVFRGGVARLFPEQWERLLAAVPEEYRDHDVVEAFVRMLHDSDPAVRERAAGAWCLWESATPAWPPKPGLDERFADPVYALAFARIVTHYAQSCGWLEDGALLRGAAALAHIPCVLVNGRFDFQAPIANAWMLHRAWPGAELVIVDDAGHGFSDDLTDAMIRATDRFAARRD